MKRPEIIAEIGVNYYDIATSQGLDLLEAARLMIHQAAVAGVPVVKFQTYKADKLAAKHSPAYWDTTEETTTSQRTLFQKFDKLTFDDYRKLKQICDEEGVEFMSTPFDPEAAYEIDKIVKRHKVASADITNAQLLKIIGGFGKQVLLSVGAATLEEVQQAVKILQDAGCPEIVLLHCVLNYPTPPEHANLWRIGALREQFPGLTIGYSDHTRYDARVLTTATLLGAEVIEKHYTLDKSLKGNDHYHAADDKDFAHFYGEMDALITLIGDKKDTGFDQSEQTARRNARRGVYLAKTVEKGATISEEDVVILRPQLDGISPVQFYQWIEEGATYSSALEPDTLLTVEMIER